MRFSRPPHLFAALAGSSADHMRECAQFLKDLGIRSQADVARILDIATNPDSLFVTYQDRKRTFNANVRPSLSSQVWGTSVRACVPAASSRHIAVHAIARVVPTLCTQRCVFNRG